MHGTLEKRVSSKRLLQSQIDDGAASATEETWVCFCCSKKNGADSDVCCVCGRGKAYVARREILPLHGAGGTFFRKSQIRTLFEDEADLIETDDKQWNALHYVSAIGNRDLLQELIECGGSLTSTTEHGHTPLHLAVESGVLSSVALCVQSGAKVDAATHFEKHTALHMAVQAGKRAITLYLIDVGAHVNCRNAVGRTPLHMSAALGRTDIANALLLNGADGDAMDDHGWTARQIAEFNGHRDFEEFMVRSKLTVSQSVIKELPPAEWHSSIWSEVVDQFGKKKEQMRVEQERERAAEARSRRQAPTVVDEFRSEDSCTATLKKMLMSPKKSITMRHNLDSSKPPNFNRKYIVAAGLLASGSCSAGALPNRAVGEATANSAGSMVSGLTFNESQTAYSRRNY